MLPSPMKPPGTYKLRYQRRSVEAAAFEDDLRRRPRGVRASSAAAADDFLARLTYSDQRAQRILDSLRDEIVGGGGSLRIRQIFETPREIYRLELELPEMGYQRTTLLDRDALEMLLEEEDVREAVETAQLGG